MDLAEQIAASGSEVVRTAQRDDYFKHMLAYDVKNVVQRIFGHNYVLSHQPEITVLANLVYYFVTTVQGVQTLGEEYCDIELLCAQQQSYPSQLQRIVLGVTSSLVPLLTLRVVPRLHTHLVAYCAALSAHPNRVVGGMGRELLDYLQHSPATLHNVLNWMSRMHIAWFFFAGAYYHVIKRLLRVRYISKSPLQSNKSLYQLVGALCILPLLITCFSHVVAVTRSFLNIVAQQKQLQTAQHPNEHTTSSSNHNHNHNTNSSKPQTDLAEVEASKNDQAGVRVESVVAGGVDWVQRMCKEGEVVSCALCLSARTSPTVTDCGHVFCWDCILEWCRTKRECPLCRQAISLNNLIKCHQF